MTLLPKFAEQARTETKSGHRIWDRMAVELETAEFLYGLVRAYKPRLIAESGTGQGLATRYMAEAIVVNGVGEIVTFETHETFRTVAARNLDDLPVVTVREGVASDDPNLHPDMVFVDCVSDFRDQEIRFWLSQYSGHPLVVVHDAARPYPFHLGEGVFIPGHDGLWVGRKKETP